MTLRSLAEAANRRARRLATCMKKSPWIQLLEYLGRFTVVVAVISWAVNGEERRIQSHYQAWSIVNGASGHAGDGGRQYALEHLSRDGVSLSGLNLRSAQLEGAQLPGAELSKASLESAVLTRANLEEATLFEADLNSARLTSIRARRSILIAARLNSSVLVNASLIEANLSDATLSGANLFWADLDGAQLSGANLQDADMRCTHMQNTALLLANLMDSDLRGALGLTCDQLKSAKAWETVLRDRTLACGAPIPTPPLPPPPWSIESLEMQAYDEDLRFPAGKEFRGKLIPLCDPTKLLKITPAQLRESLFRR